MIEERWYRKAACLGMDTEAFFNEDAKYVKEVCKRCEVVESCLESAIEEEVALGYKFVKGVRGGLTAGKRAKLVSKKMRERRKNERLA